MRYQILLGAPPSKRRWPWWLRRELLLPYLAIAVVLSLSVIAVGYWLMSAIVAWRMGQIG